MNSRGAGVLFCSAQSELLKQQGLFDEAQAKLEMCIEIYSQLLGPNALRTIDAMRSIAELLYIMGFSEEGAAYMQHVQAVTGEGGDEYEDEYDDEYNDAQYDEQNDEQQQGDDYKSLDQIHEDEEHDDFKGGLATFDEEDEDDGWGSVGGDLPQMYNN